MSAMDFDLRPVAAAQHGLITRRDVIDAGGDDRSIMRRRRGGHWDTVHPAVYLVGPLPLTWLGRLAAAVLAAGESALVSHRAALVLWGLDGISAAPLELTVPLTHQPVPNGVIVHRTRRPPSASVVKGVPVTSVERTLLDVSGGLSDLIVEKAVESAIRLGLTAPGKLAAALTGQGGRGVRGTRRLRRVLARREWGAPAGSGGEVEMAYLLREAGIGGFVRQMEARGASGARYLIDIGWPHLAKGIEVDGAKAHIGPEALQRDLERQNDLFAAGIQLRRFTVPDIRRRPEWVLEHVHRFVGTVTQHT